MKKILPSLPTNYGKSVYPQKIPVIRGSSEACRQTTAPMGEEM
jgi:hypothetical protein